MKFLFYMGEFFYSLGYLAYMKVETVKFSQVQLVCMKALSPLVAIKSYYFCEKLKDEVVRWNDVPS